MVTCDDIVHGKPAPEPFLRGAALLGPPITACLVVEDAPAGVQAGLAAGAVTAALNGHQGDIAISTLVDLLARLSGRP
jgi:sugar-phosphatase